MYRVPYCTREDVSLASDTRDPGRRGIQIDRAIQSAADAVDRITQRRFWPDTGTRYFEWPSGQYSRAWRLWLDRDELIAVNSITLRDTDVEITAGEYLLEPVNSGPPYTRIELDVTVGAASATFGGSGGTQRAVVVDGVWGYTDTRESAGTLNASISSSTASTTVRVTDSAAVGVGSLLYCEGERMLVTGKAFEDTSITLDSDLTAQANAIHFTANATGLVAGETIRVNSEVMLVGDVTGAEVFVQRAQEGTPLAAHTAGASVYAPRRCTVTRAAAGTDAGAHAQDVALYVQRYPQMVTDLAIAEAQVQLAQENSSYGRVLGAGDNQREARGKSIEDLRCTVMSAFGRQMRIQVV